MTLWLSTGLTKHTVCDLTTKGKVMANAHSRRNFLRTSALTGIGLGISASSTPAINATEVTAAAEPDGGNTFDGNNFVTHGPLVGKISEQSVRIWARTLRSGPFTVIYGTDPGQLLQESGPVTTVISQDNTGWVELTNLKPQTQYYYQISIAKIPSGPAGSFITLPSAKDHHEPTYNPKGLFNFRFQFGSCASQNPGGGINQSLPTWATMHRKLQGKALFSIMNGDFIYEEHRSMRVAEWLSQVGISAVKTPALVENVPNIVGVWENYKTYLSRGVNLSTYYRHMPIVSIFDDHELVNDLRGAGTIGFRERRTVFRDIGIRAWEDYLGWANPFETQQDIFFGKATLQKGSDVLVDNNADFTKLDLQQASNLHVHWGTISAGENHDYSDDEPSNPNAGVYGVIEVLSKNRLRITPAAYANGNCAYSIGRRSYGKMSVSNCDFMILDCRTHREMHDIKNPANPNRTMLGKQQKAWLLENIRNSKADFIFIVSSVNFMIPHYGAGGHEFTKGKDEAWTSLLAEREELILAFDALKKPVFILTADLHNSFAVKITDSVWEFASGPISSVNHLPAKDEGGRPATGLWQSLNRTCDIRWSSYILPDIEGRHRHYPYYCVVQVNNVFNMPQKLGDKRWVAYPHPQVIFQYYEGRTGEFVYSEAITLPRN
jgi:alkaline phosphatase D